MADGLPETITGLTREDVPPAIAPYVRALGMDRAVDFLSAFGGAPMSFSARQSSRSRVVDVVGLDGMSALQREVGRVSRVPLAKSFVARYLHEVRGMTIGDIARQMRASDVSVRAWVKGAKPKSGLGGPGRQMSLF